MAGKIRILDKATCDKIAAGEVVETPASVVKELVENSIDAGATSIVVEIKKGGKFLIRVTDNGEGMVREDVPRAFLRHATSKIQYIEDLERIRCLGFRGEALASIAAVSRVNITTRTRDSIEGTFYSIHGGREIEYREAGCPEGTTIEVMDLFYNTPARREYLKSDGQEASRVSDIICRLALSRTDISFRFINNGKVVLNTPGNGNLVDTVTSIYGWEIGDNLLEISCNERGVYIKGCISRPHITRATRSHQSFFINGRYVRSRFLSQVVEEAYKTLLMVNRHPIAVIFIEIDPGQVDVNVHPAKLQVKFKEEGGVREALAGCIKRCLNQGTWVAKPVRNYTRRQEKGDGYQQVLDLKEVMECPHIAEERPHQKVFVLEERVEYNREEVDNNIKDDRDKLPSMKVIGQFLSTYILAEGRECVYLIDQHAAHERILYEKLVNWMKKERVNSQKLIEPIILELTPAEIYIVKGNLDILNRMGFEIEEFGSNALAIRSVPVFFGVPQTRAFISDLIDGFGRGEEAKDLRQKEEDIIRMACKKAVKANKKLTVQEMEGLIRQLNRAEMPFSCPHGRPVIVTLTKYELEKMFRRVQ